MRLVRGTISLITMNSKEWVFEFGLVLLLVGQLLHAQQAEAGRKLLAFSCLDI